MPFRHGERELRDKDGSAKPQDAPLCAELPARRVSPQGETTEGSEPTRERHPRRCRSRGAERKGFEPRSLDAASRGHPVITDRGQYPGSQAHTPADPPRTGTIQNQREKGTRFGCRSVTRRGRDLNPKVLTQQHQDIHSTTDRGPRPSTTPQTPAVQPRTGTISDQRENGTLRGAVPLSGEGGI